MTSVKDEDDVVHIGSDGFEDGLGRSPTDTWFALCEVAASLFEQMSMHEYRHWGARDTVDEQPNCISCLAVVREELRPHA